MPLNKETKPYLQQKFQNFLKIPIKQQITWMSKIYNIFLSSWHLRKELGQLTEFIFIVLSWVICDPQAVYLRSLV